MRHLLGIDEHQSIYTLYYLWREQGGLTILKFFPHLINWWLNKSVVPGKKLQKLIRIYLMEEIKLNQTFD